MTSKRQVEYSFFGLLLFFILPFGFFEGQLLSEDNRKMGTYLIINAAFAIIAFAHLPFRIQFHIPGIRLLMILMAWLFVIHLFRDNYNQSLNNFSNILFTQVLVLLMVNFAWRIHFHRLLDILLL